MTSLISRRQLLLPGVRNLHGRFLVAIPRHIKDLKDMFVVVEKVRYVFDLLVFFTGRWLVHDSPHGEGLPLFVDGAFHCCHPRAHIIDPKTEILLLKVIVSGIPCSGERLSHHFAGYGLLQVTTAQIHFLLRSTLGNRRFSVRTIHPHFYLCIPCSRHRFQFLVRLSRGHVRLPTLHHFFLTGHALGAFLFALSVSIARKKQPKRNHHSQSRYCSSFHLRLL